MASGNLIYFDVLEIDKEKQQIEMGKKIQLQDTDITDPVHSKLWERAYDMCMHGEDCPANDSRYRIECCCDFELNAASAFNHLQWAYLEGQKDKNLIE